MKRFGILKGVVIGITALILSAQIECMPSTPVVKQQNNAPVIEKITYAKDVFSNSENELICLASDVDGDNLTYRWTCTNADGTATSTIEIKMKLGETQPVVIDKQRERIWTTTNIICIVEKAEGNQLTYTWSANSGKITGKGVMEGTADRIGWTAPGVQSDSTIDVKVKDGQGRQAIGQVNIHVFCCGN
ncbi:MAG: hypothetical protein NTZ34_02695 [Chloroflexi bacterium]|nr:hypothetical protein [Chloroflexota bacterium]